MRRPVQQRSSQLVWDLVPGRRIWSSEIPDELE